MARMETGDRVIMKNLKVAKKLFISYALIFVLLIAGYIVSIADLMGMGRQIETILRRAVYRKQQRGYRQCEF